MGTAGLVRLKPGGAAVLLSVGATLLTLLLAPGGAAAARGWSEPEPVATVDEPASELALATNDAGAGVLAWVEGSGLRVATRRSSGVRWHRSPLRISLARRPQLAIDSQGNVVLAWEQWVGADLILKAAAGRPGKGFEPPASISGPLGEGQGHWKLGANRRGDAILVWSQYRTEDFFGRPLDRYFAFAATKSRGQNGWAPPVQLGTASGISPSVALADDGSATAAWRAFDESTRTHSVLAASYSSGAWGTAVPLSAAGEAISEEGPQVVESSRGITLVAWTNAGAMCEVPGEVSLSGVSFLPGLGAWSAPQRISRAGECPREVRLGIYPRGGVEAIWSSMSDAGSDLRSTSNQRADLRWSKPAQLARIGRVPPGFSECQHLCPGPPLAFPSLTIRGGAAVVAWAQPGVGIRAALRPPKTYSRSWGDPRLLFASSRSSIPGPVASVDRRGRATVAWARKGAILYSVASPDSGLMAGTGPRATR